MIFLLSIGGVSLIKLISVIESELALIQKMQRESFKKLYEKYQDHKTSPYRQTIMTTKKKFSMEDTYYYFLVSENVKIGFVRIVLDVENRTGRIAPIAIRPVFENNGYGSECLLAIEDYFSDIKTWKLSTIRQEAKLLHFYEKNGYQQLNSIEKMNDQMDIVYFIKKL